MERVSPSRRAWWPLAFFIAWSLGVCVMAILLKTQPNPWKWIIHVGVYLLWTAALSLVWRRTLLWRPRLWAELLVACAGALVGEGVQYWTPNHSPEWLGVRYNLYGVGLAAVCVGVWDLLNRRSTSRRKTGA